MTAGPLPGGTPGTIAVARTDPGLMLGYLGAPEATEERMLGDWFLTGDSGAMNEEGWVTYLGRNDDMINAGGYRVSPIEVEEVLVTHPSIHEAAAVEYEVKPGTSIIAAFYCGTETAEAELLAHCARGLARYKCPRKYVFTHELPRGSNGKIQRRALRQRIEVAG